MAFRVIGLWGTWLLGYRVLGSWLLGLCRVLGVHGSWGCRALGHMVFSVEGFLLHMVVGLFLVIGFLVYILEKLK